MHWLVSARSKDDATYEACLGVGYLLNIEPDELLVLSAEVCPKERPRSLLRGLLLFVLVLLMIGFALVEGFLPQASS